MKVICKVLCLRKGEVFQTWDKKKGAEIEMCPVTYGEFFQATPSGLIKLGILNEEASKQFEVGKEYFVTFEEA